MWPSLGINHNNTWLLGFDIDHDCLLLNLLTFCPGLTVGVDSDDQFALVWKADPPGSYLTLPIKLHNEFDAQRGRWEHTRTPGFSASTQPLSSNTISLVSIPSVITKSILSQL